MLELTSGYELVDNIDYSKQPTSNYDAVQASKNIHSSSRPLSLCMYCKRPIGPCLMDSDESSTASSYKTPPESLTYKIWPQTVADKKSLSRNDFCTCWRRLGSQSQYHELFLNRQNLSEQTSGFPPSTTAQKEQLPRQLLKSAIKNYATKRSASSEFNSGWARHSRSDSQELARREEGCSSDQFIATVPRKKNKGNQGNLPLERDSKKLLADALTKELQRRKSLANERRRLHPSVIEKAPSGYPKKFTLPRKAQSLEKGEHNLQNKVS